MTRFWLAVTIFEGFIPLRYNDATNKIRSDWRQQFVYFKSVVWSLFRVYRAAIIMFSIILAHFITLNTILRPTYTFRRYLASPPLNSDVSLDQSPSNRRICEYSIRVVVPCCMYTVLCLLLSSSYTLRHTCINKPFYRIFYHRKPFDVWISLKNTYIFVYYFTENKPNLCFKDQSVNAIGFQH